MRKKIIITSIIVITFFCLWLLIKGILYFQVILSEHRLTKAQNQAIENIVNSRREEDSEDQFNDPFGDDGLVKILFIGLDTRVGQESGHCDAIQLISIDKNTETIEITAVPRGTYSPLPSGKGVTSTDYYISNACGLGGLEYGIGQIEKILGTKADYLVVVGFSETLGIFRYLHLPTTETLQWLRNRHGYSIGEPQRAHNHSTFIKQMMIKFIPTKEESVFDTSLQYIVYKLIQTDLSFKQIQSIMDAITRMDIANYPEKIKLSMRPLYVVEDIAYDPGKVNKYLNQTLGPIKHVLSKDDYSDLSTEALQTQLLEVIENNKNNLEFLSWAYQNNIWLQIEDLEESLIIQHDLLDDYLKLLPDKKDRQTMLADYILEMENRGESLWQTKGKDLLTQEID